MTGGIGRRREQQGNVFLWVGWGNEGRCHGGVMHKEREKENKGDGEGTPPQAVRTKFPSCDLALKTGSFSQMGAHQLGISYYYWASPTLCLWVNIVPGIIRKWRVHF